MILINLKDGVNQYWTENIEEKVVDGMTWLVFETRSKKGKVQHHTLLKNAVQEITDVGEVDNEE